MKKRRRVRKGWCSKIIKNNCHISTYYVITMNTICEEEFRPHNNPNPWHIHALSWSTLSTRTTRNSLSAVGFLHLLFFYFLFCSFCEFRNKQNVNSVNWNERKTHTRKKTTITTLCTYTLRNRNGSLLLSCKLCTTLSMQKNTLTHNKHFTNGSQRTWIKADVHARWRENMNG